MVKVVALMWARVQKDGRRRLALAESLFSAFKRLYGEAVRGKKREKIVQEIRLKVHVYNLMVNLAKY